jgi:hypothetical protein
MFTEQQSLTE